MGFIMSDNIDNFPFQDAKDSKAIFEYLTKSQNWDLPELNLNDINFPPELLEALKNKPETLSDDSLTNTKFDNNVREYGKVSGDGTLDKILESLKANLWLEYHNGRITGAEYAQAYVAMTQGALQSAVQFLISKDKAYWDALLAQTQAYSALVDLETKKMQLLNAKFQAYLIRSQFADTVFGLAIKDKQYGTMVLTDSLNNNKDNREERITSKQIETMILTDSLNTNKDNREERVTSQQIVLNTNKDSREERVTSKQIAVMSQQIDSYKRKDERETIKLQTDAWAVTKGIAEDTAVPTPLANPAIITAMTKELNNVGLS